MLALEQWDLKSPFCPQCPFIGFFTYREFDDKKLINCKFCGLYQELGKEPSLRRMVQCRQCKGYDWRFLSEEKDCIGCKGNVIYVQSPLEDPKHPFWELKPEILYRFREGSIPLANLLQTHYPSNGGAVCYYEGTSGSYVPYYGYLDEKLIYALGAVKRALRNLVMFALKNKIYLLLGLIYRKQIFKSFSEFTYVALHYYPQDVNKWCASARELWDKGCKMWGEQEIWRLLCMVLQYDTAYRLRGLYFVKLLDREALLQNPIKELRRVLSDLRGREKEPSIAEKYKYAKILLYLLYVPKVKGRLLKFIRSLDWEKIQPDRLDLFWMSLAKSVSFKL